MKDDLQFFPLEKTHLDQCVDLFMDTFSREPWNDHYESREQVETLFQRYMANNYFLGYITLANGRVIALSIGYQKPWIHGMEYCIDEFCVGTEHQGKGIGSKLLRFIEQDLAKKGVNAMLLNTERGVPAERFYRKNGFHELKHLIFLAK